MCKFDKRMDLSPINNVSTEKRETSFEQFFQFEAGSPESDISSKSPKISLSSSQCTHRDCDGNNYVGHYLILESLGM